MKRLSSSDTDPSCKQKYNKKKIKNNINRQKNIFILQFTLTWMIESWKS